MKRQQYYANRYTANKEQWQAREQTEARRAYVKKYYAQNKVKMLAAAEKWRKENPDRAAAINKKRRAKNHSQKLAGDRLYRQTHPDKCRAAIAKARASHPEKYRQIAIAKAMRRRARKVAAGVERVSLKRIVERDSGRCHLCRLIVLRAERSYDHLIPVARCGPYAEWNLMLAHLRCNQRRGTKQVLSAETKQAALRYIAERATQQEIRQ